MKSLDVTCAIIFKADKIIVTQRSELMKMPLKWEFPGGKVNAGENYVDSIKREIMEELNIEIEITAMLQPVLFNYGTFKINLIPFMANYLSGEVRLLEHKAILMLHASELFQLDWADADIPIVKEILEREKEKHS